MSIIQQTLKNEINAKKAEMLDKADNKIAMEGLASRVAAAKDEEYKMAIANAILKQEAAKANGNPVYGTTPYSAGYAV